MGYNGNKQVVYQQVKFQRDYRMMKNEEVNYKIKLI